jgi:VCBS repeat-containing protein
MTGIGTEHVSSRSWRGAAALVTSVVMALGLSLGGAVTAVTTTAVLAAPTECDGLEATIVGTPGDDHLVGTGGADVIVAGEGDDVVNGRGGKDVICGRAGDDTVRGGKGADVLRGAAGADLLVGGKGVDQLRGGRGEDDVRGGAGDDELNGGKAVDDCDGGAGFNTVVACENIPTAAPVAGDDSASTTEDGQKLVDVLANDTDPDGDPLLVTSVNVSGTKGTVAITGSGTGVSYNPNGQFEALGAGASGSDSFSYTVSDGQGGTDAASVAVTVTGTDDSPQAVADTKTVAEDDATTISVRANDTDVDSGP